MSTPDFNLAARLFQLPRWAVFSLDRKWRAGEREHQGNDGDMQVSGFDPLIAQAAEALDVINYYLGAVTGIIPCPPKVSERAWACTLDKLELNARNATLILKRCGETAAYAAANAALERASK